MDFKCVRNVFETLRQDKSQKKRPHRATERQVLARDRQTSAINLIFAQSTAAMSSPPALSFLAHDVQVDATPHDEISLSDDDDDVIDHMVVVVPPPTTPWEVVSPRVVHIIPLDTSSVVTLDDDDDDDDDTKSDDSTPWTPLLDAVAANQLDQVQDCLAHHWGINAAMAHGDFEGTTCTPLGVAASRGLIDMTTFLLSVEDIDVNLGDGRGATPLILASRAGHPLLVALLLTHPNTAINATTTEAGETALWVACDHGHVDVVHVLLGHPTVDVNATDRMRQCTPLVVAVTRGNVAIVRLLAVRHDVDFAHALHTAAAGGHVDVVAALVDHVPHDHVDEDGHTALDLALLAGHMDVAMVLIGHADAASTVPLSFQGQPLVALLAPCLTVDVAVALLRRDDRLPRDSWVAFLDTPSPIAPALRLQVVRALLPDMSHAHVHQVAMLPRQGGRRAVLWSTDAATRACFCERLFLCGRYDVIESVPARRTGGAAVVVAALACDPVDSTDKVSKDTVAKLSTGSLDAVFTPRVVSIKLMPTYAMAERQLAARRRCGLPVVDLGLLTPPHVLTQSNVLAGVKDDVNWLQVPHFGLQLPSSVDDISLATIIIQTSPSIQVIRGLFRDLVAQLQGMHAHGVMHGALSAASVFQGPDGRMRLVDFDHAVAMGESFGVDVDVLVEGGPVLAPEYFFKLHDYAHVAEYVAHWHAVDPARWVHPRRGWMVVTWHDVMGLPFAFAKSAPAVDAWAVGALLFDALSGGVSVGQAMHERIDDNETTAATHKLHVTAAWVQDKLSACIRDTLSDECGRHLVQQLLVLDPAARLALDDVLAHPFFDPTKTWPPEANNLLVENVLPATIAATPVANDALAQSSVDATQAVPPDSNDRLVENMLPIVATPVADESTQAMPSPDAKARLVETLLPATIVAMATTPEPLTTDALQTLAQTKRDLLDTIPTSDVAIPTSFLLLPFNLSARIHANGVDATLLDVVAALERIVVMTSKFMRAVRENRPIGSVLPPAKSWVLYVVDEVGGVPSMVLDSPYPILLETLPTDGYVRFMAAAMPFLRSGIHLTHGLTQLLPPENATTAMLIQTRLQALHANTSAPFDWDLLHWAMQRQGSMASKTKVRAASVRELRRFFDAADPTQTYAGLGRVVDAMSGQSIWTSQDAIDAWDARRLVHLKDKDRGVHWNGQAKSPQQVYMALVDDDPTPPRVGVFPDEMLYMCTAHLFRATDARHPDERSCECTIFEILYFEGSHELICYFSYFVCVQEKAIWKIVPRDSQSCWTDFNASGTQTFVSDVFNTQLWNTSTPATLPLFTRDVASEKIYSQPQALISVQATDARRIAVEVLRPIPAAIAGLCSQSTARTTRSLTHYCWLDFNQQWEVAHTAARQACCRANYTANGVMYLESMLRNTDWMAWYAMWGAQFQVTYGSAIDESAGGNAWLSHTTTAMASFSIDMEVAYWTANGVTEFELSWHNRHVGGFDNAMVVHNALQGYSIPLQHVQYMAGAV
ncbi:Aste57867_9829 [Aphanomyces stellatus]|uniref:Aste57867_9829 protein n=1 Tax=Aphanomyces stellatus TaxID=120398 RepID=A0A485KNV7_9STRA|nr:hypothetical protein As57867_009790 [Aphanomyces stellatus]VFT86708.1 Aste57867_9829 [Aphanomyces stellatus]